MPPPAPAPDTCDEPTPADRPRTWGDCLRDGWGVDEPCPWVGCRYHLLLEVRRSGQGQGLRLHGGRAVYRPRTEDQVDELVERAVDRLSAMPATCALRVAAAGATTSFRRLGEVLGVEASNACRAAQAATAQLAAAGIDLGTPGSDRSREIATPRHRAPMNGGAHHPAPPED